MRPTIDIRHIVYLTAVANSGSFRRAAQTLQVRQSSVSRAVLQIENRLGVSVFERSTAGARLTDAGQRLLQDVAPVIEQINFAERSATAAGRGEVGLVRVGILTSLTGGLLRELIRHFSELHPRVVVDVRDGSRDDHIAAVKRHVVDIAFVTGRGDVAGCECTELWQERIHVALPKEHRLAKCTTLDWKDLREERFIVCRTAPGREVHDYIVRRVADHSAYAEIEFKRAGSETLMNLVSLGQGITLVLAAWSVVGFPDLVLRPLIDPADIVPFSAVWSPQNDNPALRRFLSIAHALAGRVRRGSSDWSREALGLTSIASGPSANGRRPGRSP